MIMAIVGGLIGGLVLAFITELVLDRTIKRPKDVEGILQVPLFLSIPVLKLRSRRLLVGGNGKQSSVDAAKTDRASKGTVTGEIVKAAPPERESEMKSYHDALRDRLVTYFDVRDMTHKPKLIAVTGCATGSGVSSVATGLAASLSETGDGNVLLVDMKGQKGAAHAFSQGKPACSLADALEDETRGSAQVNENLYVVAAGSADQKLQRIIPQQFSQFVPKLKASDYDYIIFDMPPVAQTSITAKVARFMDMVLMVVESERTDRDVAKRATSLLAESKASVAAVLNKRRRYVPAWLLEEFH
jgi:Mrp family chromosome partitioning ATPase